MFQLLITVLLTLLVAGVLLGVFRWVKTPYYRVTPERMIHVLEMVLTGQATENDWQITFGMTIRHNQELELLRQKCIEIEEKYYIDSSNSAYLFSSDGLIQLKAILKTLKNNDLQYK